MEVSRSLMTGVKENLPDTGANFYMVPGAIIQDQQALVISRHRPAANLVKLRELFDANGCCSAVVSIHDTS